MKTLGNSGDISYKPGKKWDFRISSYPEVKVESKTYD